MITKFIKWYKKNKELEKLNKKAFPVYDDNLFFLYTPGTETIAFGNFFCSLERSVSSSAFKFLENRKVIINHREQKVYFERHYGLNDFYEVQGQIAKQIIAAYSQYVTGVQEIEMFGG
jgi:hypothetical protein